jgi:hypothetical protein
MHGFDICWIQTWIKGSLMNASLPNVASIWEQPDLGIWISCSTKVSGL